MPVDHHGRAVLPNHTAVLTGCPFDETGIFGSDERTPQLLPHRLSAATAADLQEQLMAPFASLQLWGLPWVKLTGNNGARPDATDQGNSPSRALEAIAESRVSATLLAERLEPIAAAEQAQLISDTLFSDFDLAAGETAHVYISGPRMAALKNHTDITDIIVLQVPPLSP